MEDFYKETEQQREAPSQPQPEVASQMEGWGIDADTENEPTWPMRRRTGEEHEGYSWERPPQQPLGVEVLHSLERPNVTAVYGATVPPSGISGAIRRFAFRYSEGTYAHWLLLVMADRVNMLEGVADDLRHSRMPNVFKESGMRAEWKYNRKAVVKKAAVASVFIAGAVLLLKSRRK